MPFQIIFLFNPRGWLKRNFSSQYFSKAGNKGRSVVSKKASYSWYTAAICFEFHFTALLPGTSLSYIIGSSLCKKLLKPLNIEFLVAILKISFLPIIIENPSFSIIQSLQQRLFEMPQTKMKLAWEWDRNKVRVTTLFFSFFNQRIYCSRLNLTKRKKLKRKKKKIELPCSFSRSDLFWSTSGLSAFNTWFKHWLCRLLRVTVKFTNVTRLHRSGANSTCSYTKGHLKVKKKKNLDVRFFMGTANLFLCPTLLTKRKKHLSLT